MSRAMENVNQDYVFSSKEKEIMLSLISNKNENRKSTVN